MKSVNKKMSSTQIVLPVVCPKCEQRFDLNAHMPIMHSCCVLATCKKCWHASFNMLDEFECFFQCGRQNREIPDEPKVNAGIKRMIEEST